MKSWIDYKWKRSSSPCDGGTVPRMQAALPRCNATLKRCIRNYDDRGSAVSWLVCTECPRGSEYTVTFFRVQAFVMPMWVVYSVWLKLYSTYHSRSDYRDIKLPFFGVSKLSSNVCMHMQCLEQCRGHRPSLFSLHMQVSWGVTCGALWCNGAVPGSNSWALLWRLVYSCIVFGAGVRALEKGWRSSDHSRRV